MADLVLKQEGALVILDKPSGMSVHNEKPSLQDELRERFPKLHFVNRLDLDTSGLVVATTDATVVAELTAGLHGLDAQKIYRAVVKRPRDSADFLKKQNAQHKVWSWTDPISDRAEGRKNPMGLAKDRVAAETRCEVVGESEFFWDLRVQILTGRQHQIRKHCAIHQLPIVGDGRYGREALNQKTREVYGIDRMMLHAWQLQFPWRGKNLEFTSPLPQEFTRLLTSQT